uniref:Uncharacterized protein n=1 Tax=Strigamia maritima TaxID=126957 RepID=T1JCQ2_STRMM
MRVKKIPLTITNRRKPVAKRRGKCKVPKRSHSTCKVPPRRVVATTDRQTSVTPPVSESSFSAKTLFFTLVGIFAICAAIATTTCLLSGTNLMFKRILRFLGHL